MALSLIKMGVGCDSVADLADYQRDRILRGEPLVHHTRNFPRRGTEILAGGSLYWVIKGAIRVRQRILALESRIDELSAGGNGRHFCVIRLDPELVATVKQPNRPFQGWRYLEDEHLPRDLGGDRDDELPPELVTELRALGLA